MKYELFSHRKGIQRLCFLAVLTLLILSCGCAQQTAGSPVVPAGETPAVTITQPDASHILITYRGSLQAEKLVELEISITDSNGKITTKSMGSRMATTPIQYGSSYSVTGQFEGKDRVFVTGYFSDGSQKPLIDTTL